jgi:hypothetical protein
MRFSAALPDSGGAMYRTFLLYLFKKYSLLRTIIYNTLSCIYQTHQYVLFISILLFHTNNTNAPAGALVLLVWKRSIDINSTYW